MKINTELAKQGINKLSRTVRANSPTILTAIGVGGLITTVILAIKATPKALEVIEAERRIRVQEAQKEMDINTTEVEYEAARKISTLDMMKLSWKYYVPTIVIGGSTIACIVGSNTINLKRQAALASLYAMATEAMSIYKEKVVDLIGKGKEEKVRAAVDQDALEKHPASGAKIILTGRGKSLFYDSLSSRYFESDIEEIRQKQNDYNYNLMQEFNATLNEWYYLIGLDNIDLGDDIGWRIDKSRLNILFDARLIDGKAVIVLNYSSMPDRIY